MDGSAQQGIYVAFDCLYFDGIRALAEGLDSRLEHLADRFPCEDMVNDVIVQTSPHSVVVVWKKYYGLRNLPRLISELDNPCSQFYVADGVIFTPRKNGYKTIYDPNMFRWTPVEKYTIDFRLMEGKPRGKHAKHATQQSQQPFYELHLSRMVGKEMREVSYAALDSNIQSPTIMCNIRASTMLGGIVECRRVPIVRSHGEYPGSRRDSGSAHHSWLILSHRTDKTMPDREDIVSQLFKAVDNNTTESFSRSAVKNLNSNSTESTQQSEDSVSLLPSAQSLLQCFQQYTMNANTQHGFQNETIFAGSPQNCPFVPGLLHPMSPQRSNVALSGGSPSTPGSNNISQLPPTPLSLPTLTASPISALQAPSIQSMLMCQSPSMAGGSPTPAPSLPPSLTRSSPVPPSLSPLFSSQQQQFSQINSLHASLGMLSGLSQPTNPMNAFGVGLPPTALAGLPPMYPNMMFAHLAASADCLTQEAMLQSLTNMNMLLLQSGMSSAMSPVNLPSPLPMSVSPDRKSVV